MLQSHIIGSLKSNILLNILITELFITFHVLFMININTSVFKSRGYCCSFTYKRWYYWNKGMAMNSVASRAKSVLGLFSFTPPSSYQPCQPLKNLSTEHLYIWKEFSCRHLNLLFFFSLFFFSLLKSFVSFSLILGFLSWWEFVRFGCKMLTLA